MKAKVKRTKQQYQSRKVRAEADRLHEHVVIFDQLAAKLIWRFAGKIANNAARSTVLLDYQVIAKFLAAGDPESKGLSNWPQRAMWERYAHHFKGPETQRAFFNAVDSITKRCLGDIIFAYVDAALCRLQAHSHELLWDQELLPSQIAPHVLRQWTWDSAATRSFLTTLFDHFADFHSKGSMGRRAILASHAAFKLGWKPQKLTKVLITTGDIKLGQHDYKVQTKIAFDQQAATVGRSLLRVRKEVAQRRATVAAENRRAKAAVRAALKRARIAKKTTEADRPNHP